MEEKIFWVRMGSEQGPSTPQAKNLTTDTGCCMQHVTDLSALQESK
jgi:hypothetical protein